MAHEIAFVNGKASMAYAGEKPWHGLGTDLSAGADIDTWKIEAGMNWDICSSPVWFQDEGGFSQYEDAKVLYRSDTKTQLSIVGDNFKVVQPGEVLEFFRELVERQDMKLSTAGVLFGGRKFWALADTGRAAEILGDDRIRGMLLLTTACDGTLATTAQFTSVRVVCNNTLRLSLAEKDSKKRVRCTHRTEFDPLKLKNQMGLIDHAWSNFLDRIKVLSKTRISETDSRTFLKNLLRRPDVEEDKQPNTIARQVDAIIQTARNGMGSNKAHGTLWGLLNGITEYCDHSSGHYRSDDRKLWASWFGKEEAIKSLAYDRMLELV